MSQLILEAPDDILSFIYKNRVVVDPFFLIQESMVKTSYYNNVNDAKSGELETRLENLGIIPKLGWYCIYSKVNLLNGSEEIWCNGNRTSLKGDADPRVFAKSMMHVDLYKAFKEGSNFTRSINDPRVLMRHFINDRNITGRWLLNPTGKPLDYSNISTIQYSKLQPTMNACISLYADNGPDIDTCKMIMKLASDIHWPKVGIYLEIGDSLMYFDLQLSKLIDKTMELI